MLFSRRSALVAGAIGLGLAAATPAEALPRFRYYDLGPARQTYNVGIDDNGRVAWDDRVGFGSRVKVWSAGRTLALPLPAGAAGASFSSISTAGITGTFAAPGQWSAFAWFNGITVDLQHSADSARNGIPPRINAMNNAGEIVGSTLIATEGTYTAQASMWEGAHGVLLENDNLAQPSEAHAINDAGRIAGVRTTPAGKEVVTLWEGTGILREELRAPDGWSIEPTGINASDMVIGAANSGGILNTAVLWKGDRWVELGGSGLGNTIPEAINDRGQVVGHTNYFSATLWQDGRHYDLNSLVQGRGDAVLRRALDINEDGWIVGLANDPTETSSQRVFLAVPTTVDPRDVPSPPAATLLGIGAFGIARRARR